MHIVASVQARLGSTRLPGKVLYHLENRRLLQWAVDRPTAADKIDETVVTIGDQPENDAITEFCERTEIPYNIGPEENLLTRHLNVTSQTNSDLLVRITADCPFVPTSEISRLIQLHLSNDARYTTNGVEEMPIGTAVDVINEQVLEELKDFSLGCQVALRFKRFREAVFEPFTVALPAAGCCFSGWIGFVVGGSVVSHWVGLAVEVVGSCG